MKFTLEVGEVEKHTIEFNINQLLGQMTIKVNRQEIKRHSWLLAEPVNETHHIQVGKVEKTNIRIEKERKQLFGQKCRVFLNDRLYKCYVGV